MLGRDHRKVYSTLLKTVLHTVGEERFPEILSNPLLTSIIEDVASIIATINSLVRRRTSESIIPLRNALGFLELSRDLIQPLYIILCDALSLPEYMLFLYTLRGLIAPGRALLAINPSGKTATFKYLASEYLGVKEPLTQEDVTMRVLGELLKKRLRASGATVFREIDMLIHGGGEYRDFDMAAESLYKALSRLEGEVERLVDDGYKVLILADHGYDIIKEGASWKLTHRWEKEKMCVSPFVPILIIG
ncbi:MAG: hypothetical protein QXH67_00130 [Candidatus Bathyarchaeia archaeon]